MYFICCATFLGFFSLPYYLFLAILHDQYFVSSLGFYPDFGFFFFCRRPYFAYSGSDSVSFFYHVLYFHRVFVRDFGVPCFVFANCDDRDFDFVFFPVRDHDHDHDRDFDFDFDVIFVEDLPLRLVDSLGGCGKNSQQKD